MPKNPENGAVVMPRASTMLYDCEPVQGGNGNNSGHHPGDGNPDCEKQNYHKDRLVDLIREMPVHVGERLTKCQAAVGSGDLQSIYCVNDLEKGVIGVSMVCDKLIKDLGKILCEEFGKEDKESIPLVGHVTHLLSVVASVKKKEGYMKGDTGRHKFKDIVVDDFFLPPEAIRDVLTIGVDEDMWQAFKGNKGPRRGRGRKRKEDTSPQGNISRISDYDVMKWNPKTQEQLCQLISCILSPEPLQTFEHSMTSNMCKTASKLRQSGACQGMQLIGATLEEVRKMLNAGGFLDPDEFLSGVDAACKAAVDVHLQSARSNIRKGKLVGYADGFVNIINDLLVDMLGMAKPKRTKAKNVKGVYGYYADDGGDPDKPKVKLPDSIAFNREPFRHGEWRKTPFKPRPYVRLESYNIVEDFVREEISEKLKTGKIGKCNGDHCKQRQTLGNYSLENDGFISDCSCLSRNMECNAQCACEESTCLNRAVSHRNAVKIGVDVEEIDSWGMDCYTRKNIQDAILESQAFGHYDIPKYNEVSKPSVAATSAGQHAAVAADVPSPSSAPQLPTTDEKTKITVAENTAQRAASEWIELILMPAVNKQGAQGWDLGRALDFIIANAEKGDDQISLKASQAIKERLVEVGPNYFRLHPKGVGLVCKREKGIPPLTFVEEYLGEIHTPWRWFELQDAVKKLTGSELPDFYNIVLERPKDDPAGYDVLFVDAAAKGAVASRMSHSCTPNCQAVVMACNGRLTIALYTLRQVHPGEELTFDYSSVTESEKEFKQAICLCGTHMCRGSYLYFTGSRAFMQILTKKHNILHRQVILIRSAMEAVSQADKKRLQKFGLGSSCLGSQEKGTRVPPWLEKWTALICEYLDMEEKCLREDFLKKEPYQGRYTEAAAAAEAKGVIANRLQNIAITLDKVRMVLKQRHQTSEPPLRLLEDQEIADHLWNGPKSIGKRLLRGSVHVIAPDAALQISDPLKLASMFKKDTSKLISTFPDSIHRLAAMINEPASSPDDARQKLGNFCDLLREIDNEIGGGLTAAVDAGTMYAFTTNWVTVAQGYKTFTSPKVPINLEDLFLNREEGSAKPVEQARLVSSAHNLAKTHANNPALQKIYRPTYVWGQLSGWFKQTVNDPTASLSADRRGAISLPDIESSFKRGTNYVPKDRRELLEHLTSKPDGMWKTGTLWQFKNESKYYGSPMLDQAWYQVTGKGKDPMPLLLKKLKSAKVPPATGRQGLKQEKIASDASHQRRCKGQSSLSDIYVLD